MGTRDTTRRDGRLTLVLGAAGPTLALVGVLVLLILGGAPGLLTGVVLLLAAGACAVAAMGMAARAYRRAAGG